ncbi:hypothetical protein PG995_007301 [Apiospora arundinis]
MSTNEEQDQSEEGRSSQRMTRSLAKSQTMLAEARHPANGGNVAGQDDGRDEETNVSVTGIAEKEVHEDDLCSICRLLLHDPVLTHCHHTLCRFCMATWASVSLGEPMVIVDVDEEPAEFDSVADLEARCPMCRTLTTAHPSATRRDELKAKYPHAYAEREGEVEAESQNGGGVEGGESVQTMTVYIGNRHQDVEAAEGGPAQNTHDWTFFVRPSRTEIIEEVHMFLHPTFRQNHVIRQRSPYQISRRGWGTFVITVSVILKAGYSWVSEDAQDTPDGATKGMLPLEWELDFDGFGGKGSMGRCRLKVKHDRDWDDEEGERDDREWRRMVRQYEQDGRYEPD